MHQMIAAIISLIIITISLQWIWDNLSIVFLQETRNGREKRSGLNCTGSSFSLNGMSSCHPWLTCSDIKRDVIVSEKHLGSGVEKVVMMGTWQHYPVAVSMLRHEDFMHDFQHNLAMLQLFSKEPGAEANKVVQLVGWCFENTAVIITEMHALGSADKVHIVLKDQFPEFYTLKFRFRLCIDFVQILNTLHSHPDGPRVLCDANDPEKALSQFLLTDNLTLVLNDLDALPLVNKTSGDLVKCGHRELYGDFVAPEQLWPYDNLNYKDDQMPHYDEKVDIWKIPDICGALLGEMAGVTKLQLLLFNIHSQCKRTDPQQRPLASEVLSVYEDVYKRLK